jgi:hypothetical protein
MSIADVSSMTGLETKTIPKPAIPQVYAYKKKLLKALGSS